MLNYLLNHRSESVLVLNYLLNHRSESVLVLKLSPKSVKVKET